MRAQRSRLCTPRSDMTSPRFSLWSTQATSQRDGASPNDGRQLPGISIVVTSFKDTALLHRCLERLTPIWSEAHAQVIVVHTGAGSEFAALAQEFASVIWITTEPGTQESDLRRIGFERSSRDVVLFLDSRDSVRCDSVATLCRNWRTWRETGGRVSSAPVCASAESTRYPYLSVVIPVCNGGPRFLMTLQALALSDLSRQAWELVIVDDGSTDETAVVAAQYADKLLRLRPDARGPGYARNRGFELTLGDCVGFINADVMVETDTLRNAVTILTQHPELGAIFGSCDAAPLTKGFLSRYRSLVQRFYHQSIADDACTFSSACGIVRSSIFEKAGGYDEWHFSRRQLEDLELGQRLRSLGTRIVPHSDIRATHLRKWTLRQMVATEIVDRAVPRMRLQKRELFRDPDGAPRRRRAKNLKIGVSWLGVICGVLAWHQHSVPIAVAALACLAIVLVSNGPQLAFFARERGVRFAACCVPIDLFYYLIAGIGIACGWVAREAFGEPTPGAVAEAYVEMGVKRWPPVPMKRIARHSATAEPSLSKLATDLPELPLLSQQPNSGDGSGDISNMVQ
jgi:glycosyl transferase family 2